MWTDIPVSRIVDSSWKAKGERGWDASIVDQLDTYLNRSSALPVHIFIDLWMTKPIPKSILHKILASFARKAYRWETAVILFDESRLPDLLSRWQNLQMPRLQRLNFRMRMICGYTRIIDEELPIIESLPPTLKELVLDGYSRHWGSGGTLGPGLESFTGLPYKLESLFKTASTLKSCNFRGIHIREMRLPHLNQRILFPSLTDLEVNEIRYSRTCVHFDDTHYFTTIFSHIDTPNLKKLVVNCGRTEMNCTQLLIGIFDAALASSWRLTSLSLNLHATFWIFVVGILKLLPTLRDLDIYDLSEMINFFSLSISSTNSTSFWDCNQKADPYRSTFSITTYLFIGWRKFLAKQLFYSEATSGAKFTALMRSTKQRKKPMATRTLDFKNISHVLGILELSDFLHDDNILESCLIELLDALATLPNDIILLKEADLRSRAAEGSRRLVERIRVNGHVWPHTWMPGENVCSLHSSQSRA
ncbi:hypothetical protein CPB83DRAFT_898402 [Crepidotus variabilis]|uniref:Uncharacterized protein n=1 Tax=Crepidotus variabilis TaxID=179855 RepID=A0A9P6JKG6_9AGAR|nr:hypothetical protein CPB83DRAFT_898402 [Crepidotus variabilis]